MSLAKLIVLIGLTCVLILYLSTVFRPKKTELPNDTTSKIMGFYALEPNSMDVLFLGTSHSYYGFNPSVLYAETGLNSYVFAGECQPFSVTYHYLVEALKTQNPQLIVLDVFALLPSSQKCQTSGIIKKNVEDFNFSQNKIEALSLIKDENLMENLLDISIYKDRWNELTKDDFLYPLKEHFNDSFGYTMGYPVVSPLYHREMYSSDVLREPEDENLKYLYKIFNLVRDHELDLWVVKTPYYETEEEYEIINYIFNETENEGFKTINFNQLYDELDFIFDRDGDVWHCNLRGAWKVTDYLSQLIKKEEKVSIQPSLYHEQYMEMYKNSIGTLVWTSRDIETYLKTLSQLDVTLLVNYCGKDKTILDDENWELLQSVGIHRFDVHQNYVAAISEKKVLYQTQSKEYQMGEVEIQGRQLICDSGENWASFRWDDTGVELNLNGLNIIVVDNKTMQVIDKVCIDTLNEFKLVRE